MCFYPDTSGGEWRMETHYCAVKIVFPDKTCLYSFGGMILSNSQKASPSIKYHYFDPEGGHMFIVNSV